MHKIIPNYSGKGEVKRRVTLSPFSGMTLSEAVDLLSLPPNAAKEWIRRGYLHKPEKLGKKFVLLPEEFVQLVLMRELCYELGMMPAKASWLVKGRGITECVVEKIEASDKPEDVAAIIGVKWRKLAKVFFWEVGEWGKGDLWHLRWVIGNGILVLFLGERVVRLLERWETERLGIKPLPTESRTQAGG